MVHRNVRGSAEVKCCNRLPRALACVLHCWAPRFEVVRSRAVPGAHGYSSETTGFWEGKLSAISLGEGWNSSTLIPW